MPERRSLYRAIYYIVQVRTKQFELQVLHFVLVSSYIATMESENAPFAAIAFA